MGVSSTIIADNVITRVNTFLLPYGSFEARKDITGRFRKEYYDLSTPLWEFLAVYMLSKLFGATSLSTPLWEFPGFSVALR